MHASLQSPVQTPLRVGVSDVPPPPVLPRQDEAPPPAAEALPQDVQAVAPVLEAAGPVVQAQLPDLQPLAVELGHAWLRGHLDVVPQGISASRDNLVFRLADGTTTVIGARQVEALVGDDAVTRDTSLAHAALIFDAGAKSGLPSSAITSILGAYSREVGQPPVGRAAAFQKAMTTVALAADVENYVRNPKGLSRDMRHVGAFTDEAANGLHLKGMKNKLRSDAMKMEVIRQHQYALDDGLNRFAAAFSTARETGDYAGAFTSLQRFYQRAATITSTSYWQARPQLVATDLEPPVRPGQPSDLVLGGAAGAVARQGQAAKADRLVVLQPQQPSRAARFWAGLKSPVVAIGELRAEKRAAQRHAEGTAALVAARGEVDRLSAGLSEARSSMRAAQRAGRSTVSHEATIRRCEQALVPAQQKLEAAKQRVPGLVGVGAAAAVIAGLRQDGTIPARGSAAGLVETRAIDLNEVILGSAYTSDLNSNSGVGDAYEHLEGVSTQRLTNWSDLPQYLAALRARQEAAPTVRGELRHVLLNLTSHGNEWGFMTINHTDEEGIKHKSHASAAWVNEQLKLAGFAPTDVTVVSEACNGAYVYERSRGGLDESLGVSAKVEALNRTSTTSKGYVYDVSGDVRAAHRAREAGRDFTWVGRYTHENLGPSVIHQYVSGLGLSDSLLASEAARRHTVRAQVYLSGEVLREHLPIVMLNRTTHTFVSDGEAPALAKVDRAQGELRLDMHAVQAALHASDDPTAADRLQHPASALSTTSEPHG